MYNRYIPQPDGTYRRNRVEDAPYQPRQEPHPYEAPPPPAPPVCEEPPPQPRPQPSCGAPAGDFLRQLLPKNLDTGDLMIILLLLLMAGDCREDRNTALLTLAIYLFL